MSQGGFSFASFQGGVFDARTVDPAAQFTVPVRAKYIVGIVAAEPKENNNKTGGYLELTLQIMQGVDGNKQYSNVTVPYRLHLFHGKDDIVQMAQKQLSALCHVLGILTPQHTNQLLCNMTTFQGFFIADIGPQKDNEQYSNVFGVYDLQGNAPGKKNNAAIASGVPQAQAPAPVTQPLPPVQAQPPASAPWGPPAPNFAGNNAPAPTNPAPAQVQPPWGAQPQQNQAPAPTPQAAPPWQQPNASAASPAQAAPPWAR